MPTSVMPKGVEHMNAEGCLWDVTLMPTSVMPKGVEHEVTGACTDMYSICPPL